MKIVLGLLLALGVVCRLVGLPLPAPLLQEAQITSSRDGKRVCRIDVDMDAQTPTGSS